MTILAIRWALSVTMLLLELTEMTQLALTLAQLICLTDELGNLNKRF